MEVLWFLLLAFLLVGYVLLDGYDLGAGSLHLMLTRNDSERKQVLASVAPFWDANEVWLISAGGTLFSTFPAVYANSFGGFYLPLMIVLWLLILRACSIDFRNHVDSPIWAPIWDAGFAFSSLLLALFFGVALGNVLRGVPIEESGQFFLPLWTTFSPFSPEAGILDWYTILVGALAVGSIVLHGALWIHFKVEGDLSQRARTLASRLIPAVAMIFLGATIATFIVQPQAALNLNRAPWGVIFPSAALVSLGASWFYLRRPQRELHAFMGSSAFLFASLAAAAFTLFPLILPSTRADRWSLSIYNSNAGEYSMKAALYWWIPGMTLAVAYSVFSHWYFKAKVPQVQS